MTEVLFMSTGTTWKQHVQLVDHGDFLCGLRSSDFPAKFEYDETTLDNAFEVTSTSGLGLEQDRYVCLRCLKKLRNLYTNQMMSTTYQQLQQVLLEHLSEGDSDEICLSSPSGEWTRKQLAQAVRQGNYEGIRFVNSLVKLSLDLVLRGKEKIDGFEVVLPSDNSQ